MRKVYTDQDLLLELKEKMEIYGENITKRKYIEIGKYSIQTLQRRFGSWSKAKGRTKEFGKESKPETKDTIQFPDLKESEFNIWEWFDLLKTHRRLDQKAKVTQDVATIDFSKATEPIAISYSSDWHLGSLSVDYDTFVDNIKYLLKTPNLFMAVVGDTIENFIEFKNKSAIFGQGITPQRQHQLLMGILKELINAKKLLYVGWGDHDVVFDEKIKGYDDLQYVNENGVPFLAAKGLVVLKVGKNEYTNTVVHRSLYNSFLNEQHASSREYQLFFPADITITAHKHNPGFAQRQFYPIARQAGYNFGGKSILLRTGTYKIDDTYSMRHWNRGIIGTPTVIYRPDVHDFDVFESAEKAVKFMGKHEGNSKVV